MGSSVPEIYKPIDLAWYLEAHGRLPEKEALEVVKSILRGVVVMHGAKLLHGDLKPSNILKFGDRWVLGDPGLTRFFGEPPRFVARGWYPTELTGGPPDDLFAAGVIFSALLFGNLNPREFNPLKLTIQKMQHPIAKIICRAVAENPALRYRSAEEILHDVEGLSCEGTSK